MAIFIEIMAGAGEGSRYQVDVGTTLGRAKADILIRDPKVSTTHAKVVLNAQKQFVLEDLDSSNGLHLNGRRVKKITLLPGVTFEVGRTLFKVLEVDDHVAEDFSRIVTWRGILKSFVSNFPQPPATALVPVQAFSPALKLLVVQGLQSEQEFFLGYGPRMAGSRTLDIELLDPRSPEQAFELLPGPGMVQFKSLSPKVLLNGQKVSVDMLKDGDLITVGETVLRVSYY